MTRGLSRRAFAVATVAIWNSICGIRFRRDSATIVVTPEDDSLPEPTEAVVLTLTENAAYTVEDGAESATVSILDTSKHHDVFSLFDTA